MSCDDTMIVNLCRTFNEAIAKAKNRADVAEAALKRINEVRPTAAYPNKDYIIMETELWNIGVTHYGLAGTWSSVWMSHKEEKVDVPDVPTQD